MELTILEAALEALHTRRIRIDEQIAQVQGAIEAWAPTRGETSAPKGKRATRKLSPEAIARIRAGQKKRWAAYRKAQKKGA